MDETGRAGNRKRSRTEKRGEAYQRAVGEVAKALSPSAHVEVGVWVDGPDGRRDLDVVVRLGGLGTTPFALIECKDWNRPIGIGFIDALDSKRKDVGASSAMICSNSGFTEDALRKAARVGIPALSALIKGDKRVKVVVRERIYTRIVQFSHHTPTFHHPYLSEEAALVLSRPCHTKNWTFQGKSVEAWVAAKLLGVAGPATRSRSFTARYSFGTDLPLDYQGIAVAVSRIDIRAAFTVQWMTQVAQINASQGMYDYLRKVVLVGPGQCQFHQTVNSESWGEPIDIEDVPPRYLVPFDQRPRLPDGSVEMSLGMVKNMPRSDPKDAADLDRFVEVEEIVDESEVGNDGGKEGRAASPLPPS